MRNLCDVLKKQRDKEARLRLSDASKNIIIGEDGSGGQTSHDPAAALTEAVESLNSLTGDVTISAGAGITLTPTGNDIEIATDWAAAFTDLTDAPAAYTGAGGKFVAVKVTADGLEFVAAPAGGAGSFDYGLITDATSTTADYGGLS